MASLTSSSHGALRRIGDDRSVLAITGKDRVAWLNGLVTCDLTKERPEHYGLVLEKKGKIVTDFYWLHGPADTLYLLVPRIVASEMLTLLEHHLIMEDAEVAAVPLVPHWLYFGEDASAAPAEASAEPAGPTAEISLRGLGGGLLRASVSLRPTGIADLAHGAAAPVLTAEAWDALRHGLALPLFGVDFDATMYPQEAGVEEWAVSFEKGCYLGQEVVYMQKHRGQARRRLVELRLVAPDGIRAPAKATPVTNAAGATIGEVTSSASSPAGAHVVALLKTSASGPGAEVFVDGVAAVVR